MRAFTFSLTRQRASRNKYASYHRYTDCRHHKCCSRRGQYFLLKPNKGLGTLLGHIENVSAREVSVVGAGVAGTEAIKKGLSSGAHVNVLDISQEKLNELQSSLGTDNISYILSDVDSISEAISRSDLVIGSVYVVGKEAPKVITKQMLKVMKPGSVLVDISIDQGG